MARWGDRVGVGVVEQLVLGPHEPTGLTGILDGARRRHRVAAAEVDHQDRWQRSELAFAAVGSSVHQVAEVLDAVERFVWSFPEVEVVDAWRRWLDDEEDRP